MRRSEVLACSSLVGAALIFIGTNCRALKFGGEFSSAHSIIDEITETLHRRTQLEVMTGLLQGIKEQLAALERSGNYRTVSATDAKKSSQGVKANQKKIHYETFSSALRSGELKHGKKNTQMNNKSQGIITLKDNAQGRIRNWTVLMAMNRLMDNLPSKVSPASRICRPGPKLRSHSKNKKKCLVIGDSVSVGYSTDISKLLEKQCDVYHAPWSGDGGSLDTKYILQCLPLFLSSNILEPVSYDVIVFNSGLHDIDCSDYAGEYNPIMEYANNLEKIKIALLKTGAQVAFITSTPVPYSQAMNNRVIKYNYIAKRVMSWGRSVDVLDLYSYVVDWCGEPPFQKCTIYQKQPNLHFTAKGYKDLARVVTKQFKELLRRKSAQGSFMHDTSRGMQLCVKDPYGSKTSRELTGCPSNTTCCLNKYSKSFVGCCMLSAAMDCGDSWHCCPKGSVCDPGCTEHKCSCRKAPWESKAARNSFNLLMIHLNTLWEKLISRYQNASLPAIIKP